jgi:lipopolysaccharide export system protein LptA
VALSSLICAAILVVAPSAGAQAQRQAPSPIQGFSVSRDRPVKITSDTLEVRDKEKLAIFNGTVHIVQGDTEMRCKTLNVFYEESAASGGAPQKSSKSAPGGGSNQIRWMKAEGGVVVMQRDQVVTGDNAEFDVRANVVTMIGNVVLTKGTDIVKGQRLVVNLTTGVSRVESGGGRVEMLMESKPRSGDATPGPSIFPTR